MACGAKRLVIFSPAYGIGRRLRRVVLAAFWIEVMLTLWAASFGGSIQGDLNRVLGMENWMHHVLAFTALGVTALVLWRPAWRVVTALLVFAFCIEAMQSLISTRVASLADAGASAMGIFLAWGILRIVRIYTHATR